MSHVTGISELKSLRVILKADEHTILSDEPVITGGTNEGMDPFDLIAASLASCTIITIQMYLRRKEWEVEELRIEVDLESDLLKGGTTTVFTRKLFVRSNLPEASLQRLKTIADSCAISKMLKAGNNSINTTLEKI